MRCALALVLVIGCGFPRPARVDGDARPGDGSAGDAPAQLSYPANPAYLKKGVAATPDVPVIGGGPVSAWNVSPNLPSGLSLDSLTGVIDGTPTVGAPLKTYTVTARNPHGETSADIQIRVNDITQIASGSYHACAVDAGAIVCWGGDQFGELGNGKTMDSPTPVEVMNSTGATAVACGERHTCAIINGAAKCWGDNTYGELGTGAAGGQAATPQQVQGLGSGVVAIAASQDTSCAVVMGAGVQCWGRNQTGELGNGTPTITQTGTPSQVPANIPFDPATDQLQATSSGRYFCVLSKASNRLTCWGDGSSGQFLNGNGGSQYNPVTVPVPAVVPPLQTIATGVGHICAVANGQPWCWGINSHGQTGDTTSQDTTSPKSIASLPSGARQMAAGHFHTCLVYGSGVVCWGQNNQGELGNGMQLDSTPPVQATGITGGATQVAAGYNVTCALVNGDVQCWGDGEFGHLGNGSTNDSATPVAVVGL